MIHFIPRFILHWLRGRQVRQYWVDPRPWTDQDRQRIGIHLANTTVLRRLGNG